MTIEATFVQALQNDLELAAHFAARTEPSPWIYSSSSLGLGDNPQVPEFPYIVYNELPSSPYDAVKKTSNAEARLFTFYVYDEMGDFTRINTIQNVLRKILKRIAPFRTSEGGYCLDTEWQGISGRIVDDGYHSNVRFSTVRFTVSE